MISTFGRLMLSLGVCIVYGLINPFVTVGDAIVAESSSQAHVQAALSAASDGDTVIVPAGTSVWTASVSFVNKSITLQGAGVDQTVIIDQTGSGWLEHALVVEGGAGKTFRITGFTWDAENSSGMGVVHLRGSGTFRLDHCKFRNIRVRGLVINTLYGVVDNCVFIAPYDVTAQGVSVIGDGDAAWNRPMTLGSEKAVYVEDCEFNYSYQNDGVLDAYGGARYVFRYNTVNNALISHHGCDSGSYRSTHSWEVYSNQFTKSTGGNLWGFFARGGTGVVFNNTYIGNYSSMYLANYRSCGSYGIWGQCDGGNPLDGNEEVSGYPCYDQCGRTTNQELSPIYAWENTLNGESFQLEVRGECGMENTHIQEGRDFYNNEAKPGYAPLAHPHPIRGELEQEISVQPPRRLRVLEGQ